MSSSYSFAFTNNNKYLDDPTHGRIDYDYTSTDLFGTFVFGTSYPLEKKDKITKKTSRYFTPELQFRYSPNDSLDISGNGTELSYNSAFSFNRIGSSETHEGGRSVTLGTRYSILDENERDYLNVKLANVLRDKKNPKLPTLGKLDQTRTDIVGELEFNPNDIFNLNYQFSLDRDLDYSNYDYIQTKFNFDKFTSKFNYITRNHEGGNSESVSNNTIYEINDESTLTFNTGRDLLTDFTEYYNLVYQYETDCMIASFNYSRKFYRDENLLPENTLFFYVRFIPFVELFGSANQTLEQLQEQLN